MPCLVMRDTRLWKYGDRFREEEAYPGSKYCETQHCNRSVTFSFLCHDSSLSSSSPTTTSHASWPSCVYFAMVDAFFASGRCCHYDSCTSTISHHGYQPTWYKRTENQDAFKTHWSNFWFTYLACWCCPPTFLRNRCNVSLILSYGLSLGEQCFLLAISLILWREQSVSLWIGS